MKFIIDESVSYAVVVEFRLKGHEVLSIAERQYAGSSDNNIYDLMIKEKAILVTRDFHFTNSIRFPTKGTGGIIYLRKGNLKAEEEVKIVKDFISKGGLELVKEHLVTLDRHTARIR